MARGTREFLWIALATVAASSPALLGGWVYDDWIMANSPLMDDLGDLGAVFARTSAHYLATPASGVDAGVTYRPLSMASLIAVQATLAAPLAHHVVSLGLHLLATFGLLVALRRLCAPAWASLMTAAFALHPCAIEAYGWINGRSDLLAALGLVSVALGLTRVPRDARAAAWILAGTLLAGLSKETGLVAVAVLLTSFALPVRGLPSRADFAQSRLPFLIGLLGAICAVGARLAATQAGRVEPASLASMLVAPTLVMRLLGVTLESILVPAPRAMLGLAWQLDQPVSSLGIVLICLLGAAWLGLIARQRFRAAALVAGALLTILPCVVVRHGLWNGFDRYLYMPTMMLPLAAASTGLPQVFFQTTKAVRTFAALAFAAVLAAASYETAKNYAGEGEFINSMIALRPDDPTGYLTGAAQLWNVGDVGTAHAMLSHVKPHTLPPGLALHLATLFRKMGREQDELRVIAELEQRQLHEPQTLHALAAVRLYHRDLAHAFALASRLRGHPRVFCQSLLSILRKNLDEGRYTPAERQLIAEFMRAPTCLSAGARL